MDPKLRVLYLVGGDRVAVALAVAPADVVEAETDGALEAALEATLDGARLLVRLTALEAGKEPVGVGGESVPVEIPRLSESSSLPPLTDRVLGSIAVDWLCLLCESVDTRLTNAGRGCDTARFICGRGLALAVAVAVAVAVVNPKSGRSPLGKAD